MKHLMLHPDCRDGPITSVRADIEAAASGCRARFRLIGDVSAIKIPGNAAAERMDNLWTTTCCEIFWQPDGGDDYREFNLSPSGEWAAYDFDGFRMNRRDAEVGAMWIVCKRQDGEITLEANITCDLRLPAKVALNAVVEDKHGMMQFWALDFAPGKPDFHSEICRAVTLEAGQ